MSAKLPKQHLIRPEWNRQKILASGDPSTFQPIFSQFCRAPLGSGTAGAVGSCATRDRVHRLYLGSSGLATAVPPGSLFSFSFYNSLEPFGREEKIRDPH